ncbi:peptidoglycan-binding protein, partial [Patescibacteria group bacterium]|nr:peptidoglycan-binding protein [Patescibacteria group bacterium]
MQIANTNTIAKIAAVLAGLGLVASTFAAFAPVASAQSSTSSADLQAQINALLAQIAALQANTGTTAAVSFDRDLTMGSTGADVTALQNWLISKGFTIAAGATGYFGAQTKAALGAYQASVSISPA